MIDINSTRDEILQADREAIITALSQNGWILHKLPEHLKNDEDIVLAAVKKQGLALQYASDDLRKNERVVLAALAQNGMALKFVLEPLRSKIEIVLAAVAQNGFALQYAPEFKNNRDVVIAAIAQNGEALEFASEELQTKEDLIEISQFGSFSTLNLLLPLKEKLRNEKNPDLIPAMTKMISSMETSMVTCNKDLDFTKFVTTFNSAITDAQPILEKQTGWRKLVDDLANRIIDLFKPATKEVFSKKETSPQDEGLSKTEASKSRFTFFANPSPVRKELDQLQQTFNPPPVEPPKA